jgi:hypothetical protein
MYNYKQSFQSTIWGPHSSMYMNVAIFWDTGTRNPYMNRRFEGTYNLHLKNRKSADQAIDVQQVAQVISLLILSYMHFIISRFYKLLLPWNILKC